MIATNAEPGFAYACGMRFYRRLAALAPLMLTLGTPISGVQGTELRDELLKMAQHTAESVKSARVSYDETIAMKQGYLMPGLKGQRDAIPATDSSSTMRNQLVIDGRKFYFEDNSPVWGSSKGKSTLKEKNRAISANDGAVTKQYHPDGIGTDAFATGIFLDQTWVSVSEFQYIPLVYSLCPLNSAITKYDVQRLSVDDSVAKWQGVDCIKGERQVAPDKRYLFWFDRGRGVLVHAEYLKDGKMRGQINIDVGLSDSGWRPTRWTYLEQSDGQIVRTVSVANIKWELNVDVSDVDFGLDFPRNTRVFDQRTREEWVIDSSGKKHDLANVLTTKAMADLTGERARSRSWRYILTASGACVAVAIMSVLALRKRRGKARDSL